MNTISDNALDHRARRAVKQFGLIVRKSRWRKYSIDNLGGFQIIDPATNFVVLGTRFDLTAEDVLAYCKE
jgi:hypothetical protein